jgi:hypothetical protein
LLQALHVADAVAGDVATKRKRKVQQMQHLQRKVQHLQHLQRKVQQMRQNNATGTATFATKNATGTATKRAKNAKNATKK